MKNTDKWIYRLGMASILLALCVLLTVFYWMFWPYQTIIFNTDKYPVERSIYHAGETVEYVVDYCKFIDRPTRLTRVLVDGYIIVTQSEVGNLPVGCQKKISTFKLPSDLRASEYHIDITFTYEVNPIRTIQKNIKTESFIVI